MSALHDVGVLGLRMNSVSGGGIGFEYIDRYEAICAEMGWHLQFLTTTRDLEPIASRLA